MENKKSATRPEFSRREFLAGASALGGVAMASAATAAQITTAGVKPRLVPNVNGLYTKGGEFPANQNLTPLRPMVGFLQST